MDPMDIVVPEEEIQKFERAYNEAKDTGQMTDKIQFEYSWCLIKSGNAIDIKKGISLLNELCKKNVDDRRDYMYYLAIGYAHIHDYKKAMELLDQILRSQPTNVQVLSLKKKISQLQSSEIKENAAIAGGFVAVAGGLALLAYGVGKSLSRSS